MKYKLGFYAFTFGFFGFFLALASLLAIDLIRDVEEGVASANWPTVSGEVIDVFRSRNRPVVEYRYVVDEQAYTSHRVAFVRRRSLQPGRGLEAHYGLVLTEGDSVRVSYDPVNPGVAVLIPGAPRSGVWVGAFVCVFLSLIGGSGLWLALKHPPRAVS